ncbi:hypothetical protein Bhyg_08490 [Pseudolycoriella hygida]|uniref:Uncharacterized protein n=1 Tax=Pseudolycoriella hygida TaxID=35572 RepID=A0A9Q0S4E1_9DIPT|nr:hypothetical protein Bhyg_08490 [Pseudolycoriella hygida]
MLPTNVMSFMKKMVAPEEAPAQHTTDNTGGTFGKLKQTLSSSLLTAQDKGNGIILLILFIFLLQNSFTSPFSLLLFQCFSSLLCLNIENVSEELILFYVGGNMCRKMIQQFLTHEEYNSREFDQCKKIIPEKPLGNEMNRSFLIHIRNNLLPWKRILANKIKSKVLYINFPIFTKTISGHESSENCTSVNILRFPSIEQICKTDNIFTETTETFQSFSFFSSHINVDFKTKAETEPFFTLKN